MTTTNMFLNFGGKWDSKYSIGLTDLAGMISSSYYNNKNVTAVQRTSYLAQYDLAKIYKWEEWKMWKNCQNAK